MTGCAVYNLLTERFFLYSLSCRLSSLSGELFAIKKAIETSIEDNIEHLVIYTDSRSACLLLRRASSDNFLVSEIILAVSDSNLKEVHIVWVPAHAGIPFNERVDCLAKSAISLGAPIDIGLPYGDALNRIKISLRREWLELYRSRSQTAGRFFFSLFSEIPLRPWYMRVSLDPIDVKILNRLMCGHCYNGVYLRMIRARSSDLCDFCNMVDDSEHLIFHCSQFNDIRIRHRFFQEFTSLFNLLNSHDISFYTDLVSFIKEAGIRDRF